MRKSVVLAVLDAIATVGGTAMSVLTGLVAASMMLYSGYVLYDTYVTQQSAYSSWDLLRFRPEIVDGSADGMPTMEELQAINQDLVGWITVYETNIDYPVVQGEDDLYYAAHDIYRKTSLTGAIYLAAASKRDLSENYSLLYGHHMDNGAMFGDIDLFTEDGFIHSHHEGILVTPKKIYDLSIFACVATDAYESKIYTMGDRDLDELMMYAEANAVQWAPEYLGAHDKILALSTCASAETNGRLVLLCTMSERPMLPPDDPGGTTPIPIRPDEPDGPGPDIPVDPDGPGPDGPDGPGPDEPDNPDVPENPDEPENPDVPDRPSPSFPPPVNPAQGPGGGTPGGPGDTTPPGGENPGEIIGENQTPLGNLLHRFGELIRRGGVDAWALVNLICLILTAYMFMPLLHLRAKFARRRMMYKVNDAAKQLLVSAQGAMDPEAMKTAEEAAEEELYQVKRFARRTRTGLLLELLLTVLALIAFILTEDVRLPMILVDRWTPLMLILLIVIWVVDVRLLRYRKKTEEKLLEELEAAEASMA